MLPDSTGVVPVRFLPRDNPTLQHGLHLPGVNRSVRICEHAQTADHLPTKLPFVPQHRRPCYHLVLSPKDLGRVVEEERHCLSMLEIDASLELLGGHLCWADFLGDFPLPFWIWRG